MNDALSTFYLMLYGVGHMVNMFPCVGTSALSERYQQIILQCAACKHQEAETSSAKRGRKEGRKEGNVSFNDALNTVIWRRTYGKEPLR